MELRVRLYSSKCKHKTKTSLLGGVKSIVQVDLKTSSFAFATVFALKSYYVPLAKLPVSIPRQDSLHLLYGCFTCSQSALLGYCNCVDDVCMVVHGLLLGCAGRPTVKRQ